MVQDLNKNNRIEGWEIFPYWFDKLRIFPRAFITLYMYMVYNVVEWFMALPEPNMAQASLVSVVVGAGAAWFGLYVNSGNHNVQVPPQTTHNIYSVPPSTTQPVYMPQEDNR